MTVKPLTEAEKLTWPANGVVKLEKPFVDARGEIQPLVDMMMESAVIIESKKGSLRTNHFHRTDWHYCYIISGAIDYHHRPTGSTASPEVLSVRQGEIVFTPPMVDHGMTFPEDTVFLTLSRNPRDQESYEQDVVRINMMPDKGLLSWVPGDPTGEKKND